MFYVYDVYDKDSGYKVKNLHYYPNRDDLNFSCSRDTIICGSLYDISTLSVGVFDSSDGVTEYYFLPNLLKIVEETGIKIKGLTICYYADIKCCKPTNISCIKSIEIMGSIANNCKDYIRTLSKLKLVNGVEITSEGKLVSPFETFIKGDILEFPKEVKELSRKFIKNNSIPKGVAKIIVSNEFNFKDYGNAMLLGHLCEHPESYLVIDGDFHLTPSIFGHLKTNIFVRGKLTLGNFNRNMKSLSDNQFNPKYKYFLRSLQNCGVFTVSDSRFINIFDFREFKVTKVKNDSGFYC